MKRYFLFSGSFYYPSGGMGDFDKDFDDPREALLCATTRMKTRKDWDDNDEWFSVWDMELNQEVFDNKTLDGGR